MGVLFADAMAEYGCFRCVGWAILVVGATVWETAQRMNPPSLSLHTRRRALIVLSRDHRGGQGLDDVAEVLGQLAADADLPYDEGLRMVGSYAMVLADRAREGSLGEIAVAVRSLGERAVRVESAALASSVVRALWVLGLDQADHPRVFDRRIGPWLQLRGMGEGSGSARLPVRHLMRWRVSQLSGLDKRSCLWGFAFRPRLPLAA